MVSKLLKDKNVYYCSNCRMKQFQIKPNCIFCGNQFYNYEDVLIKEHGDKFIDEVKEKENEKSI